MSFSIFLLGTMIASIAALVGMLAVPTHPLRDLRIPLGPDDLLD